MQALAGILGGNPAQAYQQGRLRGQAIDTGDADAAGDAAFGRALNTLYNGPIPGAQPVTVPPGQPSQPGMRMPPQGGPPVGPQGSPGMPPTGGPPPGAPGPSLAVPNAQGGFSPPPGAPPGFGMPPGGPPMGGGQPPPSFGQPGGGIDWRAAVQAVVQANPGIQQNPRALARAVDHFMPIMNQQSLDQWRQVQGRLRVRPEMQLMEQFYAANPGATPEEAAQFFSDQVKGGQTRKDIAVSGQKSRENIAAAGRESRERIAGRTEAGRQGRFDTRERRLQSKQDFDQAFRTSSQALSRERFEWAKDKATRDQQYKQQKQALDEAHRRMQEHISATAAGDKDVLKNLKKSYDEAVKRLDASFMGKDTNKDMKTGSGTLQAYPVPPERRGDPDGTTYNNGQYRKQGDQMVPVQ